MTSSSSLKPALELDFASFNHHFLDILVKLHPAASFVYTRRDAVSWAGSFLNMVFRHVTYLRCHSGPELPHLLKQNGFKAARG